MAPSVARSGSRPCCCRHYPRRHHSHSCHPCRHCAICCRCLCTVATCVVRNIRLVSLVYTVKAKSAHDATIGSRNGLRAHCWFVHTSVSIGFTAHRWCSFLLAIWAAAAVGMGLKISWKAKRVGHALYLIIGWAALIILPWAYHRAGFTSLLLYALGGIVYTVGAVLFYLQNQNSFRISSDFTRSGTCSQLLLESCSLQELGC